MGVMSERWDFFYMFQTLAEILKETEPGLIHLSDVSQLIYHNFQKSLGTTSQPQKTPKLRQNGSATHMWKSQVNQLYPC